MAKASKAGGLKATPVATPVEKATAPVVPNLFHKAAKQEAVAVKEAPRKGTTFKLPVETVQDEDGNTQLAPQTVELHKAIKTVLDENKVAKQAENKQNDAKGKLMPVVLNMFANLFCKDQRVPAGPMTLVNSEGLGLTFVIQDKSGQYALSTEQVNDLKELLGPKTTDNITVTATEFKFNPGTMIEPAGNIEGLNAEQVAAKPKVADIVAEIVSSAIVNCDQLTDDQKASLIDAEQKTRFRKDKLNDLAQVADFNPSRLLMIFEILGSSVVKYLKC